MKVRLLWNLSKMALGLMSATVILLSPAAQAKFFSEIEAGYATGSQLSYTTGGTQYAFNSTSIPLGLRLAWETDHRIFFGLSATSQMSGKLGSTGVTQDDSFTKTSAGLEVGIMRSHYKAFLAYDFMNTETVTADPLNVNSPSKLSGSAMGLGITYYFAHHLGLSLTYKIPTYSTITGAGTYTDVSDNYLAVLLSIPLTGRGGSGGETKPAGK